MFLREAAGNAVPHGAFLSFEIVVFVRLGIGQQEPVVRTHFQPLSLTPSDSSVPTAFHWFRRFRLFRANTGYVANVLRLAQLDGGACFRYGGRSPSKLRARHRRFRPRLSELDDDAPLDPFAQKPQR